MLKETTILIKHLLLNEIKQLNAVMAILLQVISSVFVLYLTSHFLDGPAWNSVFWILVLFLSVNAVGRSFIQEGKEQVLYYYQLCSPQSIILSRVLYNTVLVIIISLISLFLYSMWLGNPVQKMGFFALVICMTAAGYSALLTFISSISSHASNSYMLMPVLSFPVIIPLLNLSVSAAKQAMDGIDNSLIWNNIIYLGSLDIIILGMAYILFPYLWKD